MGRGGVWSPGALGLPVPGSTHDSRPPPPFLSPLPPTHQAGRQPRFGEAGTTEEAGADRRTAAQVHGGLAARGGVRAEAGMGPLDLVNDGLGPATGACQEPACRVAGRASPACRARQRALSESGPLQRSRRHPLLCSSCSLPTPGCRPTSRRWSKARPPSSHT